MGSDPCLTCLNGLEPIHTICKYECSQDKLTLIKMALHNGADPNSCDKYGETLLHIVTGKADLESIKLLLEHPIINLNAVNKYMETALHKAVRVGDEKVVEYLLAAGVDPKIEGAHGTALDITKNEKIRSMIKKCLPVITTETIPETQQITARYRSATSLNDPLELMANMARRMTNRGTDQSVASIKEEDVIASELQQLPQQSNQQEEKTRTRIATVSTTDVFLPYNGSVYILENGTKGVSTVELKIDQTIEPYRNLFFHKAHFNFATRTWKNNQMAILSVLRTAAEGMHKALLLCEKGQEPLLIEQEGVEKGGKGKIEDNIKAHIEKTVYPKSKWTLLPDKMFSLELLGLEASHSQNARCFRIGIVYSKEGQTDEAEMFLNSL